MDIVCKSARDIAHISVSMLLAACIFFTRRAHSSHPTALVTTSAANTVTTTKIRFVICSQNVQSCAIANCLLSAKDQRPQDNLQSKRHLLFSTTYKKFTWSRVGIPYTLRRFSRLFNPQPLVSVS
jgi:hypothetical protein